MSKRGAVASALKTGPGPDTDHDGYLSQSELQAVHDRKKATE